MISVKDTAAFLDFLYWGLSSFPDFWRRWMHPRDGKQCSSQACSECTTVHNSRDVITWTRLSYANSTRIVLPLGRFPWIYRIICRNVCKTDVVPASLGRSQQLNQRHYWRTDCRSQWRPGCWKKRACVCDVGDATLKSANCLLLHFSCKDVDVIVDTCLRKQRRSRGWDS